MGKTPSERLPIARKVGYKASLPSPESLNKAVEVASNQLETLQYLAANLYTSLEKSGLVKECAQLIDEVGKLVANAQFNADNQVNAWLGNVKKVLAANSISDFASFHNFLASMSASELKQQAVFLDCALSDSSEFIRGYSNETGDVLEGDELQAMDTLFNAWLAENDMLSKGGVIYQATAHGDIAQDKKGNALIVPAEKLRTLLDKTTEFADFVQKNNKGVQVAVRVHPYDTPTAAPE